MSSWLALTAPAGAQDGTVDPLAGGPHAQITLLPEHNTITAGETVLLGFDTTLTPDWHTYWVNPGDSGEAMRVDWTLPAGFTTGDTLWPAPAKIVTGPLASYGFNDHVMALVPLTAPGTLPDGPLTVTADVTVLVCHEICIPESSSHTITFNDPAAPPLDHGAIIAAALDEIPDTAPWTGTFAEADGDFIITAPESLPPGGTLMPYDWGLIDNLADSRLAADGSLRHKRGDRPLRTVPTARFMYVYDGGAFEFVANNVTATPAAALPMALGESATAVPAPVPSYSTAATSLPLALLFAFLGGLVLNLMPCVFPVLFMKALSLCKLSEKEESEARIQALLYTAGIVLTFVAVAGLLIALRTGGAQIGWGFQLQNPVVIMVLAYLFFVLGLNLSGFFEISARFAGIGQRLMHGSKHSQSFFMGVLATVVATPCTAPFMGAAMGYALLQGPLIALTVFVALGLGLACPYVLLSYVPALRHKLPRPGAWMEVFRRLLAIPMFLTVLWLVWVYAMQVTAHAVAVMLAGLVLMTAAFAIGRRHHILGGVVLALLAIGAPLAYHPMIQSPVAHEHDSYSPEKLTAALATGRPVFVNMTAAWCITCKVNEKGALSAQATKDLFHDHNVLFLEGDWTNQNPAITAYLATFGRTGVPLYVFYAAPDKVSGMRPDPVVLPQLLTPGILADHIQGD